MVIIKVETTNRQPGRQAGRADKVMFEYSYRFSTGQNTLNKPTSDSRFDLQVDSGQRPKVLCN